MLDLVGFWSYARHDDDHSDGQLSQLRVIVGKAIGLKYGAEAKLWQDIAAIPFGADWAKTIEQTIGLANFFIPIVTPRFLKSRYCYSEFMSFQNRMAALRRDDLIFPVHYVNVDDVRNDETVFGNDLAVLRRHQWIDFRPLLYSEPRSPEIRRWAGDLATSILKAMRRSEPLVPGVQSPMPAKATADPIPSESGTIMTLRMRAERGDAAAQFDLANAYFGEDDNEGEFDNGLLATKPELQEAVGWYRKAAEQGHTGAQVQLGWAYNLGHGVEMDPQEAVKWYRKAAERGDALGQFELGRMYDVGFGVERNVSEAIRLYRKSAEQENPLGLVALGSAYHQGRGIRQDQCEGARLFRRAAELGDDSAQWLLGSAYKNGAGVKQDRREAEFWFRKAADQGFDPAAQELRNMGISI